MTSASFPRDARLLTRSQFLATQAEGKRVAGRFVVLYVNERKEGEGARLGLTVSKKVSHLSVDRNLLRRRLRHLGRVLRPCCLRQADVVLIAKPSALAVSFPALASDVVAVYKKAHLLADEFQLEQV